MCVYFHNIFNEAHLSLARKKCDKLWPLAVDIPYIGKANSAGFRFIMQLETTPSVRQKGYDSSTVRPRKRPFLDPNRFDTAFTTNVGLIRLEFKPGEKPQIRDSDAFWGIHGSLTHHRALEKTTAGALASLRSNEAIDCASAFHPLGERH